MSWNRLAHMEQKTQNWTIRPKAYVPAPSAYLKSPFSVKCSWYAIKQASSSISLHQYSFLEIHSLTLSQPGGESSVMKLNFVPEEPSSLSAA